MAVVDRASCYFSMSTQFASEHVAKTWVDACQNISCAGYYPCVFVRDSTERIPPTSLRVCVLHRTSCLVVAIYSAKCFELCFCALSALRTDRSARSDVVACFTGKKRSCGNVLFAKFADETFIRIGISHA